VSLCLSPKHSWTPTSSFKSSQQLGLTQCETYVVHNNQFELLQDKGAVPVRSLRIKNRFQSLILPPASGLYSVSYIITSARSVEKFSLLGLEALTTVTTKSARNYWGFKLCPSSGILNTRKHNFSETGSASVRRWSGGQLLCWAL
jgi:hypothetical protein